MKDHQPLDFTLLKQLTQAYGPSGNEQEIAGLISELGRPYSQEILTDALGNIVLRRPGTGKGKKLLLVSHMDEVGVIVTHIDDKGYLYFAAVGGVKNENLLAKRVMFANRYIGVVNRDSSQAEQGKPSGKYYIDLGVRSEKEARSLVREGDMAVLVGDYQETGNHILSKALDDRAGCFIALEVLKQIECEHDLYFAFTVQEEVGARGAKTVAHQIKPDLALILDTTLSFDSPKEKNRTSLNQGAAIKVMDRSIVVSPQVKNWMYEIAQKNDIAIQWEIISEGGTDSGPVHLSRGGIPTGGIAIPVRYLHSGNEIAAKYDLHSAYLLTLALLQNPSLDF